MERKEAIEIIKAMDNLTDKQKEALNIVYHDVELRITKQIKGKRHLTDGKYHFMCPHCNGLIRPDTSERICCLCGGELSWKNEIRKGNVIIR